MGGLTDDQIRACIKKLARDLDKGPGKKLGKLATFAHKHAADPQGPDAARQVRDAANIVLARAEALVAAQEAKERGDIDHLTYVHLMQILEDQSNEADP